MKYGTEMHLTTMEFELLLFLASHPSQVFAPEELMHKVWDYTTPVECFTVTVHTRRLREKVEGSPGRPTYIKTVWGTGYKFEGYGRGSSFCRFPAEVRPAGGPGLIQTAVGCMVRRIL